MAVYCTAVAGSTWTYTGDSANSVYDADALCPGFPLVLDRTALDDFAAYQLFPVWAEIGNLQSSLSDAWSYVYTLQSDLQSLQSYTWDLEVRIASLEAGSGGGGGGGVSTWMTEITTEQGALIAGAILAVWAVAWVGRTLARVLNLDEGNDNA